MDEWVCVGVDVPSDSRHTAFCSSRHGAGNEDAGMGAASVASMCVCVYVARLRGGLVVTEMYVAAAAADEATTVLLDRRLRGCVHYTIRPPRHSASSTGAPWSRCQPQLATALLQCIGSASVSSHFAVAAILSRSRRPYGPELSQL